MVHKHILIDIAMNLIFLSLMTKEGGKLMPEGYS